MGDYKIEYVTLSGGASLPAYKLICPDCKTMVLGTTIDTNSKPWQAHCPDGHVWDVKSEADA